MRKKKEGIGVVLSKLTKIFPKKYLLIIGIILTIITSIFQIGFSYLFRELLDITIAGDIDKFYVIVYITIGVIILNLLLTYFKTRFIGYYTEGGVKKLRGLLADKIVKMKAANLTKSHSGDYASRATNDMNHVRTFTFSTLPELIQQPLMAVMALVFLLIFSWKLTLITLAAFPILFIGTSLLNKPVGLASKKQQEKLAKVNTVATDYIKGVEVSKAYTIEEELKTKYDNEVNKAAHYGKKLESRISIVEAFSQIMGLLPFFVIFIIGGLFVKSGDVTIGTLLGFIYLLNYVANPISYLPRLLVQSAKDKASIIRIFEVLDLEEENQAGENFDTLHAPMIEFKNVSFSYPGQEKKVFDNLSLKINTNESIALVGPSGGGKSTVTKLLLGFYDQYEGEILIGGHELKDWQLENLRGLMSYVSQDTFLFPETIYENIQYGNLVAQEEEIIDKATQANAHQFITEFKNQYQTQVGELGGTLSGGQKQRITIARAMLKEAPIFLLDEATSALDNESEALIQKALDKIFKEKTSIIIAHRLSTIKNVDKIIVLKDGQIIDEGTHEELLTSSQVYHQLYQKQFKDHPQNEEDDVNEE